MILYFSIFHRSVSSRIVDENSKSEKNENKDKPNLERSEIDKIIYESKICNSGKHPKKTVNNTNITTLTDEMISTMIQNDNINNNNNNNIILNSSSDSNSVDFTNVINYSINNYNINNIMSNDDVNVNVNDSTNNTVNSTINSNLNMSIDSGDNCSINNSINNSNSNSKINQVLNLNTLGQDNEDVIFSLHDNSQDECTNDVRKSGNRRDSGNSVNSSSSISSSFSYNSNNNNIGLNQIQKNKKLREKSVREMITEMEVRAKNNLDAPPYVTKLDKLDQDLYTWQKTKGTSTNSSDESGNLYFVFYIFLLQSPHQTPEKYGKEIYKINKLLSHHI